MTAAYIRGAYEVPAKRGARITIQGKPATIVGFRGPHIRIRVDGTKNIQSAHPTWEINYHPEGERK